MRHTLAIVVAILLTLSVGYVSATNAQESEFSGGGGGGGTVTVGGGGSLTTNSIPYASGATELSSGPLYRAAAARIGLGGTTDSEPGFRWAGTTIDFVTAGAGAFIKINALSYQLANSSIIMNASDGLVEMQDSVGVTGGIKVVNIQGANTKALNAAAATPFVRVAVSSNSFVGGYIVYTVHADDATDYQSRSGIIPFSIVNKAGTETVTLGTVSTATEVVAVSAGTLTNTITGDTTPTNAVDFSANAASSLTETTLAIKYRVVITSGTATITPQ